MNLSATTFAIVLMVACLLPADVRGAHDGVPALVDSAMYTMDVRDWWAAHPFNPEGPYYDAEIISPLPIVDLPSGQSIQGAIDALPPDGGTIRLEPGGSYTLFYIIGRSNVHIICEDADNRARIVGGINNQEIQDGVKGPGFIATAEIMLSYRDYDIYLDRDDHELNESAWQAMRNPLSNFYFRNLIFDGNDTYDYCFQIKRINDLIFENCRFERFDDHDSSHGAHVNGHMGLDNIWFFNCEFIGRSRWGSYLDGAHGSGVINSYYENSNGSTLGFHSGNCLFLANDDFTEDINGNGKIDREEERNAKYIVVQGNQFGSSDIGFAATGENLLVRLNEVRGAVNRIAKFGTRWASTNHPEWDANGTGIRYVYFDHYVEENWANRVVQALVYFDHEAHNAYKFGSGLITPEMGRHQVINNTFGGTGNATRVLFFNTPPGGQLVEPNFIYGNTVDRVERPTGLSATVLSAQTVGLQFTDNADDETGFIIERGSGPNGSWTQVASLDPQAGSGSTLEIEISGLAPDTDHFFRTRSTATGGESFNSNVTLAQTPAIVPTEPPAAPVSFSVALNGTDSVTLQWADVLAETSYTIERARSPGGPFTVLATLPADTTLWTDEAPEAWITYYYRVRAGNNLGQGDSSTVASISVPVTLINQNLLANGDMEESGIGASAAPANWSNPTYGQRSTDLGYKSSASYRFTDPPADAYSYNLEVGQILPGTTYTFSADVYTEGVADGEGVVLEFVEFSPFHVRRSNTHRSENAWSQIEWEFTTDPAYSGGNSTRIRLFMNSGGTAYVDNVHLLPVSSSGGVSGDPTGNEDGDRLNNLMELAFGTDPDMPNPTPHYVTFESIDGETWIVYGFTRPNPKPDSICYEMLGSSSSVDFMSTWIPDVDEPSPYTVIITPQDNGSEMVKVYVMRMTDMHGFFGRWRVFIEN